MPKLTIRPSLTVVVTLEGLSTSSLSCYGSSWNETPEMDALAADGIVWDRWISPIDRPNGLIQRWFEDVRQQLRGVVDSDSARLVTDDDSLSLDSMSDFFGRSSVLHDQADDSPAESIEQSSVARLFAQALEAVDSSTRLLWLHSCVLRERWDAPLVECEPIEPEMETPDETGPDTTSAGKPVDTEPIRLPETTLPPAFKLSRQDDPDLVFAWMNRYAAQVRLVDQMVGWLVESLRNRQPTVVLAGTGGFSLGENGWIGHRVGPLRSPEIRLPMIVSRKGPLRVPGVHPATELGEIVRGVVEKKSSVISPETWCRAEDPFSPMVATESDRAENAVTTPTWFYVRDAVSEESMPGNDEKLFLKPDDLNDTNDISRLRREVVFRFSDG